MQSVLIYLPSQAYPLKTYRDEELGICLVPTNKMNPSTGYFQPKFATAFIHYDKVIDIERTKNLLKDLVIFKNFLYANRWLNIWYLTPQASRFKELINNISSIDNLINSLYVPYVEDYFTVDYSKFKLLEVIPKQATVDFFPLFNKFVNLFDTENELPLRRLIELFSFNSGSVDFNMLLEKPDYLTTFGRSKLTTSKLLIFLKSFLIIKRGYTNLSILIQSFNFFIFIPAFS
jgi:hypothetical protein